MFGIFGILFICIKRKKNVKGGHKKNFQPLFSPHKKVTFTKNVTFFYLYQILKKKFKKLITKEMPETFRHRGKKK